MSQKLELQERIKVERDGEQIDVYNWVNVSKPMVIRGHNPTHETFEAEIGAGDSPKTPDAVTHWVAEEMRYEGIDPEDHGIDVIDPTADGVHVL